jgi:hypothetical protein
MSAADSQTHIAPRCKLLDTSAATIIEINGTGVGTYGALGEFSVGYQAAFFGPDSYWTTYIQIPLPFEVVEDTTDVVLYTYRVDAWGTSSPNCPVLVELQDIMGDAATVIKSGTDTWALSASPATHTISIS